MAVEQAELLYEGNLRDALAGLLVCDPVMGDNGKLYVPMDMVAAFREKVVPLAWMVTPNQFEAELLTDRKILTQADAIQACQDLHKMGPSIVVSLIGPSFKPSSNKFP
jgi:pyridoxal kinase